MIQKSPFKILPSISYHTRILLEHIFRHFLLVYDFLALSCVYMHYNQVWLFFFFFLRVFWKFLFGLHCKFFKFKYLTLRVFKLKKKKGKIKHKEVKFLKKKEKKKGKGNRH
jgi:hypothetical protein